MSMPEHDAPKTYQEAGVDIDRADRFVDYIRRIDSKAVGTQLGAFGGAVPIPTGYRRPLLVSTTDGVGTKILVAKTVGDYSTIGIDLVAMNVNDLAVCGVKPLSFLDYIACGSIDENILQQVISGIVRGCEIAGCTLTGGETAEMPDLYGSSDIDLAGFCTGVVEADDQLPKLELIAPGDVLYGLPSSGVHSNGLSLARKAIPSSERVLWKELLKPTKIYVPDLETLIGSGSVLAAAHVTGGGLVANLERVLPDGVVPDITWDWPVPPIFDEIAGRGGISQQEMRTVFNLGIGIVLVAPSDAPLEDIASEAGIELLRIGIVADG